MDVLLLERQEEFYKPFVQVRIVDPRLLSPSTRLMLTEFVSCPGAVAPVRRVFDQQRRYQLQFGRHSGFWLRLVSDEFRQRDVAARLCRVWAP